MNRWQYPVHIPPARRVGSGVRRVSGEPIIPLQRRISRRDTVIGIYAEAGSISALAVVLLALLWRALGQ